jgi:glutamyl-tRNA synthetase
VLGPDGHRLAKRHGAVTLADLGQAGMSPAEVRWRLAVSLGLAAPGEAVDLSTLRDRFDPEGIPTDPWVLDRPWV